jgi:hypothetical protein
MHKTARRERERETPLWEWEYTLMCACYNSRLIDFVIIDCYLHSRIGLRAMTRASNNRCPKEASKLTSPSLLPASSMSPPSTLGPLQRHIYTTLNRHRRPSMGEDSPLKLVGKHHIFPLRYILNKQSTDPSQTISSSSSVSDANVRLRLTVSLYPYSDSPRSRPTSSASE